MDPDRVQTDQPYYVQGETVRGEPRVYWVEDRRGHKCFSEATRDRRQAQRWCDKLNARALPHDGKTQR